MRWQRGEQRDQVRRIWTDLRDNAGGGRSGGHALDTTLVSLRACTSRARKAACIHLVVAPEVTACTKVAKLEKLPETCWETWRIECGSGGGTHLEAKKGERQLLLPLESASPRWWREPKYRFFPFFARDAGHALRCATAVLGTPRGSAHEMSMGCGSPLNRTLSSSCCTSSSGRIAPDPRGALSAVSAPCPVE